MMESSGSKSEMKEIKVRLWGSGVGVGTTTRKIALVPAGFMAVRDPNQPQKPPAKGSPKKRKHSDHQDEKESVTDTVMEEDQSSADVLVTIDFDSETNVGTRPEFSLLRLPRNAASNHDMVSSAEMTNAAETRADASSTNGIKNEKLETTASSSSAHVHCDTLDRFWKSIEDGNYFQPFSTKSHHLDDLCIRGGDYAELSAVLPLGNTTTVPTSSGNQTMATNGTSSSHVTSNGIIAGIANGSTILNGHNVPSSSNGSCNEMTDEKASYEDDITNILYERLLLSIVKSEDTSNAEPTAGLDMAATSSQEMATDGKDMATDGKDMATDGNGGRKRKVTGTKEKKTTAKGRKSNTKGGDDSSKDNNGHVNNGDSEVDSVSMSSGTFFSIKSDSLDFDGVEASISATSTLLNCGLHGTSTTNVEHSQNCNSSQCNQRKNGVITSSSSATTTNATTTFSSSSAPTSSSSSSSSQWLPSAASSSSSSSSSSTMMTFGRSHRTIVELVEFGLINAGNVQGLGLNMQGLGVDQSQSNDKDSHNSYIPRLSPMAPIDSSNNNNSNGSSSNHGMSINTAFHDSSICGYLKEQMTTYWADDELSLAHRETVKLLEETEKQLNERIVNLRQFMSHPEVHQEESNRKRQNELHRSVIGRLVKFRKKERQQAQLAHKVQQRQKSRDKKMAGGGSCESGGES